MTACIITASEALAESDKYKLRHNTAQEKYLVILKSLKQAAKKGDYATYLSTTGDQLLRDVICSHGFCVIENTVQWGANEAAGFGKRRGDALMLFQLAFRANEFKRAMHEINLAAMSGKTMVAFVTSDELLIDELKKFGYRYESSLISWGG